MTPIPATSLGHEWVRHEDGRIDIFAFNPVDPHNGPRCARCGEGFCHHCEPDRYKEPCRGSDPTAAGGAA